MTQIVNVGSLPNDGTGDPLRTAFTKINTKFNEIVSVKDFGAKGDGVTDDSASFTSALTSGALAVYVPPSNFYIVHDVTIPNGVSLLAYGAYFRDAPGANFILKLTGFGTKLLGAYISSASNCAIAAIVVDDGNYQLVRDVDIVNSTTGIRMQSSSNGGNGIGNSKAFITNVTMDNFSVSGLSIGPNVHDANIVAVYADANTVAGGGGQIPKVGTTGFSLVGTGSVVSFGGNQFVNTVAINCQTGYQITDANLDDFVNIIADTCSGIGINLTGSTNGIILDSAFVGFCAGGIAVNGTGGANQINGLRTNNIGVIPSFGGTTFYSSAGFSAPFFDLSQANTGFLSVALDAWLANGANAHSFTEAVVGNIQMNGGVFLLFNSNGTVPANSTVFLGPNGQNAAEGFETWIAPQPVASFIGNAARIVIQNDTAPGAGQTFTYTLRVNALDTAITGTTSGTGVFQATMTGGPISIGALKTISIKLVTSATAAAAKHRGYIQLIPQPS